MLRLKHFAIHCVLATGTIAFAIINLAAGAIIGAAINNASAQTASDVIIPVSMKKSWEFTPETFTSLIATGYVLRAVETIGTSRLYFLQKPDGGVVYSCTSDFCLVTKKPS